jgi:hypothetical protein
MVSKPTSQQTNKPTTHSHTSTKPGVSVCSFRSRFLPGRLKLVPNPAVKEKSYATATATATNNVAVVRYGAGCDKKARGKVGPRERVATAKRVQAAVFTDLLIVRFRLEEPQHEL